MKTIEERRDEHRAEALRAAEATGEWFQTIVDLASADGVRELLNIQGVWECVQEHYTNEAIDRIHEQADDEFAAEVHSDWKHAHETWERLDADEPCDDPTCTWPNCDCNSSETIMLSTGYAEVYRDGAVISGGRTVFRADEDLDLGES